MVMIAWRDLRAKCKICKERADFSVEYTNDDLPKNYLRDGTRLKHYCLEHLPKEVMASKENMMKAAQRPFGL